LDRLDGDDSIELATLNTVRHSDSDCVLEGKISALHTEGCLVSWASAALVPLGTAPIVPGNNTTSWDIRHRKFASTLLTGPSLDTLNRSNWVDTESTVGIQVVNRIIVSKVARRDRRLRTGFRLAASKLEVASEPVSILTDTVEDLLTNNVTIVVLEETATNRDELTTLSIEDSNVVQVIESLSVEEATSKEHVSVIQPSSLPDIIVDTVFPSGTHPDASGRIQLANTIVLITLSHINCVIEDIAATKGVEDSSLVEHEATYSASKLFLESGAAIKRDARKSRKTLREGRSIKRAQMPEAAMAYWIPILNGIVPLGNVIGKVCMLGVEMDKGESTTDVDVSRRLGTVKQDAIDRKRMLLSQRTKSLTDGEVFTSRSDANNLRWKISKHLGNLLACRRSNVEITSSGIPLKIFNRWITSATIALDLKAPEMRDKGRPSVGSGIVNGNTLPLLRGTMEPEAIIVPLHALWNGSKTLLATSSSLVPSDWPVSLLPAIAPNVPPTVVLTFPSATHVEDITDPLEASNMRNTLASIKAGLCSHWRPFRVTESTLPVLNASVSGCIDDWNNISIVERMILVRKRRAFLCEIDMRIPPGKEIALESAILLRLTTDTAEGTVEDDIIGANDSATADGHRETTQARTHLLPGVGGGIINNTKVNVSTTSALRVEETRVASTALAITTEGTCDVDLAIRTLLDGVSITAEATTASRISPYLVDRIPASDGMKGMRTFGALLEGTNDPNVAVLADKEIVNSSLIEISEISSI